MLVSPTQSKDDLATPTRKSPVYPDAFAAKASRGTKCAQGMHRNRGASVRLLRDSPSNEQDEGEGFHGVDEVFRKDFATLLDTV